MLVADGEIVERGRVGRVDLDRPLPAVDRLAPQAALRDVDAERHLRLGVARARRPQTGAADTATMQRQTDGTREQS